MAGIKNLSRKVIEKILKKLQPKLYARDLITKGPWVDVRKFGVIVAHGYPDTGFRFPDIGFRDLDVLAEHNRDAVQAAIDHAGTWRHRDRWRDEGAGNTAVSDQIAVALGSQPTVYFPSGIYVLKGSLRLSGSLRGENNSILVQQDPDSPTLVAAEHSMIDNLAFFRGKHAIVHCFKSPGESGASLKHCFESRTGFSNDSTFIIQHCQFHKTSDFAIFTRNANNTVLTIKDCKFMECWKVLRSNCDMALVERCYVKLSSYLNDEAAFENSGGSLYLNRIIGIGPNPLSEGLLKRLGLEGAAELAYGTRRRRTSGESLLTDVRPPETENGIPGVPTGEISPVTPQPVQRWIDNHGALYCTECDFHAHRGPTPPGFVWPRFSAIVKNFASARTGGLVVSFVNSRLGDVDRVDGRPQAAIHLAEVPNIIEFVGNVVGDMHAIKVDDTPRVRRLNKDFNYDDIRIPISGNAGLTNISAMGEDERLITFMDSDLFKGAERHSDNVANLFHYPDDAPNTDLSPAAVFDNAGRIVHQGWRDPAGAGYIPQRRDGPQGMDATNIGSGNNQVVLDIALDFVEAHIEKQKEQQGQQRGGIYTFSVFVRTRKAKVALTAFGKKITAFKISPLWSRLSGSFYFDGVLPDHRDHTTSLGFTFAFDAPDSFVDVCGPSLNEGHIPSPYVLPGDNWIVTSPENAPIYWAPRGWATEDPQTRTWRPIAGSWRKGDIVYNENAQAGGFIGWVCVADGTPGEWRGFGRID